MRKKLTPEEKMHEIDTNLHNDVLGCLHICPDPTVQFEVGDSVEYGSLKNVTILSKFSEGKYYKISAYRYGPQNGPTAKDLFREEQYVFWYELFPIKTYDVTFSVESSNIYSFSYNNATLDVFKTYLYRFGLDLDPVYQRGYVWSLKDKHEFIHSIFDGLDIGKFVLIRREYVDETSLTCEVLDGKQRINTLKEFWEGRLRYQGITYREMCKRDRTVFDRHMCSLAMLDNDKLTLKDKLNYFIRLNTMGRIMDSKHLDKVRSMYESV